MSYQEFSWIILGYHLKTFVYVAKYLILNLAELMQS